VAVAVGGRQARARAPFTDTHRLFRHASLTAALSSGSVADEAARLSLALSVFKFKHGGRPSQS
jgi:hypothetical protein